MTTTQELPALLPCPFCGGTSLLVLPRTCNKHTPYNAADRAFPVVRCNDCGGEMAGANWGEPATAIAAWNRRARLAAQVEPQEPPLSVARIAAISDAYPWEISLVWHVAVPDLKARGVVVDALLYVEPVAAPHSEARPGEAATERDVPPGKWKVDMPDGVYGKLPGDPPGPCDVRKVIGGYVYFVTPRTGELVALNKPRAVHDCGHMKGTCPQCHQCLRDQGSTSCPTCEPASALSSTPAQGDGDGVAAAPDCGEAGHDKGCCGNAQCLPNGADVEGRKP